MAVKIKLMRLGKMRAPYYRIVVADARTKREGRVIETIGKYHPKENPSFIEVDGDRAAYWLSVGAQPTEPVAAIFRVTGDWQKFKGEPAPPPMLVAEPRPDRKAVFEAAARESVESGGGATTPRKKAAPKADTTEARAAASPAESAPVAAPAEPAATAAPAESAPTAAPAEPAPSTPASEPAPSSAATESAPATASDDSASAPEAGGSASPGAPATAETVAVDATEAPADSRDVDVPAEQA